MRSPTRKDERVGLAAEGDAEPLATIACDARIELAERAAHGAGAFEAVGARVGVGELCEGDDFDGVDQEPSDPRREGASAGFDARAEPAADRRAFRAIVDGLPETFFEEELSHGAEAS